MISFTKMQGPMNMCIKKIPIFLTWVAETNEQDKKERSLKEGRNSPSQESGLNEKLAGNNNVK